MCIATCPERALRPGVKRPVAEADVCTACLACVEVCPVDAITITAAVTAAVTVVGRPPRSP